MIGVQIVEEIKNNLEFLRELYMNGRRAAAPGITLEVMIQVTPGHKADLELRPEKSSLYLSLPASLKPEIRSLLPVLPEKYRIVARCHLGIHANAVIFSWGVIHARISTGLCD